jgi:hypothetical protein
MVDYDNDRSEAEAAQRRANFWRTVAFAEALILGGESFRSYSAPRSAPLFALNFG